MPILIISDSDDAHLPFVTKHLSREPVIIGSRDIVNGKGLSIVGASHQITWNGKELGPIDAVWYRKPLLASLKLPVHRAYQQYAESAIRSHLHSIYPLLQDAFWVSDYYSIQRANSKLWQYTIATKLGLWVPKTLHTSDPGAAEHFLRMHNASVVKGMAGVHPIDWRKQVIRMFFTRKISRGEHIDLSGLHLAPAILQEAVDTDFDIRVTVVGNEAFAAKIKLSGTPKTYSNTLDWRIGEASGKLIFEQYPLDRTIADKCIEHVRRMGLQFGAIDLVMDRKGVIWFLENNPNGQWAFIEEETGQPIGKAIARILEKHSTGA